MPQRIPRFTPEQLESWRGLQFDMLASQVGFAFHIPIHTSPPCVDTSLCLPAVHTSLCLPFDKLASQVPAWWVV